MEILDEDGVGAAGGSEMMQRNGRRSEGSLSVTQLELHNILDCTTAKAAWDILEKLYQAKGQNRKFLFERTAQYGRS